jgi:putative SOS response-associated peptidase YedK
LAAYKNFLTLRNEANRRHSRAEAGFKAHTRLPWNLLLWLMRWGLIPAWTKDASVAAQLINAKVGDAKHNACVP